MNRKKFIPVSYSVIPFEDDRYLKLRVKVMHLGLNLNNTNFDQAAVEEAAESLKNIPMLAFIKKTDGNGSADFAGHEFEFKVTQDGIEYIYLGRPIGIVPESNNYELAPDESGKMFVWVDAYVWKDYANEGLKIIEDAGKKRVSMEIKADDLSYNEEAGYFDIKKYRYTGITLLGDDVQEAMVGASAEVVNFSANNEVVSVVAEFKKQLDAILNFEEEQLEELEADEEIQTVEDLPGEDFEEEKSVEENTNEENTSEENEKDFTEENEENDETVDENEENFDKSDETQDSEETNEQEGVDYSAVIEALENENAELKAELESFRLEKAEKELAQLNSQKDELIAQFSDLVEMEGYQEIVSNKENLSLEELDIRLFALRGKFSTQQKSPNYEFAFLANYTAQNNNEPEWADIVKNYKEEN